MLPLKCIARITENWNVNVEQAKEGQVLQGAQIHQWAVT